MATGPVAFRLPASASWASCPAGDLCPSYDRPTRPFRAWTPTGFPRSAHARCDRGGRPLYPEASGVPTTSGSSLVAACRLHQRPGPTPGCSSRLPGLCVTRHQQGFTCVRPSGLPLARLLPRTERGSLGLSLELRTPNRQDPPGARRGGDRSRTLTRNYASGIAGLHSASSLAIRDIVSH